MNKKIFNTLKNNNIDNNNIEPSKYLNLETLNFFHTSFKTGQVVQPSKDLTGQNLFLTGHYLQP